MTVSMRDAIAAERPERVERLRGLLDELELDALLVNRAADIRYHSGFSLLTGESAGYSGTLFVTRDEQRILADSRYTEQASLEASDWPLVATTGPIERELPALFAEHDVVRAGLQGEALTHGEWSRIAEAAPGTELHDADPEIGALRLRKSAAEIDAIERACSLGDRCLEHLLGFIRPGMAEREVAWELERFFRDNGAEGLAFDPIVLAGPRASMPHGRPSAARIEPGNVLLLDFGCVVDGYQSDMTRTLFVGEVPDEIRGLYRAVAEAQQQAIDALVPGVNGQEVDAIARRRIAADGVEPYGHGLGHGIGLETHEKPPLRRSEAYALEAGMVFSVEPGIYLPGVTGIRIEDIVALGDDGPRLLTRSPRDPVVIG
jgi:Xaa-Pro aminopeptidase